MLRTRIPGSAFTFLWLALSGPVTAQCVLDRITPADGGAGDFFGMDVASSGELYAVGAPFSDGPGGADAGLVRIYRRVGAELVLEHTLVPADSKPGQNFGYSVDLEGGRLLVGAPGDGDSEKYVGAAYVFELELGGWVERAKLGASDPLYASGYARSLALDGELAVVGASSANGAVEFAGAIYVYEHSGKEWVEKHKLYDPLVTERTDFGLAVDASQGTIVVGAHFQDASGAPNCGAIYFCERAGSGWSLVGPIYSSDWNSLRFFGNSVAIDGERALASTTGTNDQLSKVYFFERQGGSWVETQSERPSTKQGGEWFGYSLDLEQGRAAVGARLDDGVGSVYIYSEAAGQWSLDARLLDPQGGFEALFGQSVTLAGAYLLAGGPKAFPSTGSTTLFSLDTGYWTSYCTANANSQGLFTTLAPHGSLSLAANDTVLVADDAPPHQFGLFFYGFAPQATPFGNGYLCIAGGLFRLYPPILTDDIGQASLALDYTSPPLQGGAGEVEAGRTWYAQLWYRDPMGGGSQFNLSYGLAINLCP